MVSSKKKVLSAFLSLAMIGSMVAAVPLTASADTPTATPGVTYEVQGQTYGWSQGYKSDGAEAGTDGQAKRLEAIKINLTNAPAGASITYQVHGQSYGWSQAAVVTNAGTDNAAVKYAGTQGQAKRIEAIRITLNGMPGYAVEYMVHQQTYGTDKNWTVVPNGTAIADAAVAGVTNKSKRLEAIWIKVEKTTDEVAAETAATAAVVKAETSKLQADVDAATKAIASVQDKATADALTARVNAIAVTASIASTSITGAKKIQVTFAGAIDTTKASFTVKKGAVVANIASTSFSDDKTTATLTLASNLTAGDYTVTVSGLTTTPLTSTVTAKDQKAASISFTSTTAVLDRSNAEVITVGYKVLNQYNEDVTSTIGDALTCTASKGTAIANGSTGLITITAGTDYAVGDTVALSVIDATANVYNTTTLTVGTKAQVSDIAIPSIYNSDSTEVLNTAATASDFKLVVSAKDQYGNAITDPTVLTSDTIVTNSNPSVATVAGSFGTTTINGTATTTLALASVPTAGTTTISIISKTTGHMATYVVTVLATAKVDTLTLSAPSLTVAGEKTNIPFSAVDQYGNAITSASVLNAGFATPIATSVGSVSFVQDYVNNTADLVLDETGTTITSSETVVITAITSTNKVVQLSLTLQPNAKPVVIAGTTNFTTNFAVGATEDLAKANIVFDDQYGRAITPTLGSSAGDYQVGIASSDTDYVTAGSALATDAATSTFTAVAKGSSTITLTLEDNTGTAIANSNYTFNSAVVDKAGIASYQLADFGTLQAGQSGSATDAAHQVAVTVNGVLANGTTVVVPASYYTVTVSDTHVSYTAGKLKDDGTYNWATAGVTSRTIPVTVTVAGDSAPAVLTKTLTVASDASAVTTLALDTTSADYVSAGVLTATAAAVKGTGASDFSNVETLVESDVAATDQYNVAIAGATAFSGDTVVVTNITNSHDISTVAAGDTFNVTVVTSNGKYITFKVIVK